MLTAQIICHFRIVTDWADVGYFATDSLRQLRDDVVAAIRAARLVANCGQVSSGKTMMMNQLQNDSSADKDIIVARSFAVDKPRVTLPNLIMALFLDVSADPNLKAPAQPERRERLLQEMVRKARKPVVLFIDEAHDIHGHNLNGLKQLMELIIRLRGPREPAPGIPAVVARDMSRKRNVEPDSVITPQAQDFLVERLSTPLQFAEHLNRAFTDAFNLGAGKVSREIMENTLSAGFDSLDARFARISYTPKASAGRFDAHPTVVRAQPPQYRRPASRSTSSLVARHTVPRAASRHRCSRQYLTPRRVAGHRSPGGIRSYRSTRSPGARRICGMWMMQDHRRPEVARQIPHLLAAPMPLAPSFHLGLGPRAEHVQIVAPKNEHTLLPAVEQMRLQVRLLNKRPFLPRYRVGLARPLHRAPLDVDDGHQLRMHPACRPVHLLLAAAIVQVNAKRQVLRPARTASSTLGVSSSPTTFSA